MESVDNNKFEVKIVNSKRKISEAPCPNVYLNPALDILANEDPICNTVMEIVPNKKKKHAKNCDIAAFENSALDLGISKTAVNEFLARELNNVYKNVKSNSVVGIQNVSAKSDISEDKTFDIHEMENRKEAGDPIVEPIYANIMESSKKDNELKAKCEITNVRAETLTPMNIYNPEVLDISQTDSSIPVLEEKLDSNEIDTLNITNIEANVNNHIFINNTSNLSLSFIDRLALDSPNNSNQSLYLDDDLNESNIMEIKTITIITKKKRIHTKNTNPFLEPGLEVDNDCPNPFLEQSNDIEYSEAVMTRPADFKVPIMNVIPRQLFTSDTNSTISTVNDSSINIESQNEYEIIDSYRSESPVYENIAELDDVVYNKQSKILGCDVSHFSAIDILNLNKSNNHTDGSNDSSDIKKDLKHQFLKAGNKLSKKVFKTLRRTFKGDKATNNVSLNPYEVPRKPPKQKTASQESGIANPGLNLDNSDEIEIEEICEDENEYETVKTIKNTRLNMNVTPLKEKSNENADLSLNRTNTPGKKVRFDSTLNQEKIITGNSFDYEIQSPGFDSKIEKYHDELENCINERKFLQQNM